MNYYEELGLAPSASVEGLRHAYRNLARILHPDQHGDETLRRLAELQMKRLNAIYAVLSDPAQRRAYDLSLETAPQSLGAAPGAADPRGASWRKRLRLSPSDLKFAAWLVATTVVVSGLVWLLTEGAKPKPVVYHRLTTPPAQPGAPAAPLAQAQPEPAEALLKELAQLRRRLEAMEAERNAARAQVAELRARDALAGALAGRLPVPPASKLAAALAEPPPITAPAPATEAAAGAPAPPPGPAAALQPARAARFAGTWFYTPPRVPPPGKSLYPPEYIEAAIVEEAGLLRGRYYGRYRVTDRAISPEVIFQFEGRPQQDAAVLEWQGGGGMRGEIRLKLLSENSMEVTWSATELGATPGLAAGTAVLVRRLE
jgi:plasmid stabilization system protein ParE